MTTSKIALGKYGEQLAANWLRSRGYVITDRNYQCGRYEIDIIAEKNHCLHIIEVKTRQSIKYGWPEESVSQKKKQHLISAATSLLHKFGNREVQIHILAILITRRAVEYFLIENIE